MRRLKVVVLDWRGDDEITDRAVQGSVDESCPYALAVSQDIDIQGLLKLLFMYKGNYTPFVRMT